MNSSNIAYSLEEEKSQNPKCFRITLQSGKTKISYDMPMFIWERLKKITTDYLRATNNDKGIEWVFSLVLVDGIDALSRRLAAYDSKGILSGKRLAKNKTRDNNTSTIRAGKAEADSEE